MHISESPPTKTILTKCSKMTEETKHKRYGVNGNADGLIKDDFNKVNNYAQGGRLKFFKDGKFILELERSREGERMSWVSVPRKTFWPPQGTASTPPTYKQESSTSLSVSDDNSSVQSSPWQRDHSWKQATPRRNISRELCFCFWRAKSLRHFGCSKLKRRRPYSSSDQELPEMLTVSTGVVSAAAQAAGVQRIKREVTTLCNKKSRTSMRNTLLQIVQNLVEKSSNRNGVEVAVVSPRKRFLREMERDGKNQMEDSYQKRSRNKIVSSQNSHDVCVKTENGTIVSDELPKSSPTSSSSSSSTLSMRNCSYSITSLLSDDRNLLKRSPSNSPNQLNGTNNGNVAISTANHSHHHHNHHSSVRFCTSAEDRWYSESVDRLRSIELTQADKRVYPGYPHPSYLPHYMYPCTIPTYYGPGMYGRNFMVPPVYPTPPLPMTLRHDTPSCSWAIEPLIKEEENITDMPLNLSKHAG